MKTVNLLGLCLIIASLVGCQKDSNDSKSDFVSQQTKTTLSQMYPDATNIEWKSQGQYIIAEFYATPATRASNRCKHSAWLDNVGKWYMTETDITFDKLPAAVQTAFRASEYTSWKVDDVDKIDRGGAEVIYVIEVEGRVDGVEIEVDLYYTQDGVLVKSVVDSDDDYEGYIPATPASGIEAYIKANYPQAKILDIDYEDGMTEVEILDGRTKRELLFNKSNQWLYTKTEVTRNGVPTNVMAALASSAYANYRIDDIDHYVTANGEYYRFELKSASGDVEVDIDLNGVITVVDKSGGNNGGGVGVGLTDKIKEFIASKYPNAKIIEIDYDKGLKEVEIYHENRKKEVYFNGKEEWVHTKWDVKESELPAAVVSAIRASQYSSYQIDDVEFIQTRNNEHYLVELEQGDREVELKITALGMIL